MTRDPAMEYCRRKLFDQEPQQHIIMGSRCFDFNERAGGSMAVTDCGSLNNYVPIGFLGWPRPT